jgi:hypothetical protein
MNANDATTATMGATAKDGVKAAAGANAGASVKATTGIKTATPSERYAERVSWSAGMHFAQQSAIDRFCETGDHRYVDVFVRLQKFDAASKFN